jgi:hypothetical protein
MVALEIKKSMVIQAILEDPDSDLRQMAREALLKNKRLRDVLEDVGFIKGLGPVEVYELDEVVLKNMDGHVEFGILAFLGYAFAAKMPVIFDWYQREASCEVKTTIVGGKMFLTLGTPALDVTKIQPGTFAGAMASF